MKLSDKYTLLEGQAYLTGIQALVRLPMDQMRLDRAARLCTGSFISGYEGSPLGGYDFALERAGALLREHNIHFSPALNEDLAATAVFGSQFTHLAGAAKVDGVVGIWYGKGPGVDRTTDAFRHFNLAGSPGISAALVLAGDDHPCKSSSIPHQSDFSLYNVNIPILFPGNTQEILDYGLYAIAMSRYSGAWASLKLLTQTCDGGGTIDVSLARHRFELPPPVDKRHDARLVPGIALTLEHETNTRRIPAVLEFARRNPINRMHGAGSGAWLGIATAGKYYYDVMQALADFGIPESDLTTMGVRIAKFGMTFPVEPGFARDFAAGLETILVVEEKRSFLELQLREALYNHGHRPVIVGKFDELGAPMLKASHELDPDDIARAIASRLLARHDHAGLRERLAVLDQVAARPRQIDVLRTPNYCSGCPHNRSTITLEGRFTGGGIGCHGMGFLLEDAGRGYAFATHMGGEGAAWTGMAPFVERRHMFQNMGDGTYFHSGSLAIQAAIAAKVNITYRILYNGHVAMTGGQDAVGAIPIPQLTRKLAAEGVRKIAVVTEDVERYPDPGELSTNTTVWDRSSLEDVLRDLEREPGVTVLIYDQECAAEKRRKRSRGKYQEPAKRLVIHEHVCEGCGDCVTQSNCMSLQPAATPFGEKMRIHQSSCNKDYTCALGDCPSFVTVNLTPGTGLRRPPVRDLELPPVPAPSWNPDLSRPWRILAPGIGGTGVVTVNALVATAASMDGLSVVTLDQTGLAQKGGAVVSHVILSKDPAPVSARINAANADLILGFDLLGVLSPDNLKCASAERTAAVVNTHLTPTAESVRKRLDLSGALASLTRLEAFTRRGHNVFVDASGLSERFFGSHMMTNMIALGVAWQAGFVPVSEPSLLTAIELNGVDVDRNRKAFHLGRLYYVDAARVDELAPRLAPASGERASEPDYRAELTAYQNASYAARHQTLVERVRSQRPELAGAVARNLYKLMAYKDEYEVARLLTLPEFRKSLDAQWESIESVCYNLHPPLFRRFGLKRKLTLGPWFGRVLEVLASLKGLRGTPFDPFGYLKHRRQERELIPWYQDLVERALVVEDRQLAYDLVSLPEQIRGYEGVKDKSIELARAKAKLLEQPSAPLVRPGS